jgi:dipeptidase D
LTGANALEPGFIKGKLLINLDSEDEGVFTVGCAGGINTNSTIPFKLEAIPANYKQHKIAAGGMKGGHSGIDIAKQKANAIKVLARALSQIRQQVDLRIADLTGGRAHNAIPRDCETVVYFPKDNWEQVKKLIAEQEKIFKSEFKNTDPDLKLTIEATDSGNFQKVLTAQDTKKLIEVIFAMPHGVDAMSTDIPGLVETSNNLANVKLENGIAKILTSQRSSLVSRLHALSDRIEAVARLAGGDGKSGDGYPPWPPKMDSALLDKSKKLYEKMYNKKPVVEVIHAGLECGIIGDRNPGMDMISIGPDLKNPHSPDEKVNVVAVGKVWDFLVELLKELKDMKVMA